MARLFQGNRRRQKRFLELLTQLGNVSEAARRVGISRKAAYRLREQDPEFAERWEQAETAGFAAIECEAERRAVAGVEEPITSRDGQIPGVWYDEDGRIVMVGNWPEHAQVAATTCPGAKFVGNAVRRYSDRLLELLLKARLSHIYRERLEHSGPGGEPLPAPQGVVIVPATAETLGAWQAQAQTTLEESRKRAAEHAEALSAGLTE